MFIKYLEGSLFNVYYCPPVFQKSFYPNQEKCYDSYSLACVAALKEVERGREGGREEKEEGGPSSSPSSFSSLPPSLPLFTPFNAATQAKYSLHCVFVGYVHLHRHFVQCHPKLFS